MPQTPYFKICSNCHLHGNIIFPDSTSSEDIVLKEQGIYIIEEALKEGKISGFEASILAGQINRSNLISVVEIVDDLYKIDNVFIEAEKKIKEIGCSTFEGKIMN